MDIVRTHVSVNFLVRQTGDVIYSIDFVDLWMKLNSLQVYFFTPRLFYST